MKRLQVATASAPPAVGPYSQAISVGNLVFASGQIALDPATGQFIGGDIRIQTQRVLENLSKVLTAAGTSLAETVKTTVFLTSMADLAAMNEVYGEFFPGVAPARSTVVVAGLGYNALVEIDAIALRSAD